MLESGWKSVASQCFAYPYIGRLHFSDHRDLVLPNNVAGPEKSNNPAHSPDVNKLEEIAAYLGRNEGKYQQFLRQKSRTPSPDIYACFQPFNECFKALFPFVDYIRRQLKPGDRVLNLWDRSGWTASMLGGWFPDQEIVTVWEGDKDILGYKGFHYWMHPERRKNHSVVFADLLRPLPFDDNVFAAVVGMDLLHRFNQPELLTEINRVAKAGAPVIFPHVHLTNNEPDPWFDRGCRQLHGREYDFLFAQSQGSSGRKGYVCSEPGLFEWNDRTTAPAKALVSEPGHNDYNGCIAWLPDGHNPELRPWRGHESDWESSYLLQNCFLRIDPVSLQIGFNTPLYGDLISELMEQHAIYARRVAPAIGGTAEEKWLEILLWAGEGLMLKEIMVKTALTKNEMQLHLEKMFRLELAQVVPVDETGFRLQHLLGTQQWTAEKTQNHLAAHWKQAVALHGEEPWLRSGEDILRYSDGDELIILVRGALLREGLTKGDHLIICADLRPELLLLFWAAVQSGIIVVPLSAKEPPQRLLHYVRETGAKLVFAEPELCAALNPEEIDCIMFDLTDEPAYDHARSFDAWLSIGSEESIAADPVLSPDDPAVLLWTTGSTGNPKSIALSHSQLIRSGRVMTETYCWKKTDTYYALGGLEFMSGLRQSTVCLSETGASALIPARDQQMQQHAETIGNGVVTILTANPAFYRALLQTFHLQNNNRLTGSLRLSLCTGNVLPAELKPAWQNKTGLNLYNYYGLTETSGICIAEIPGGRHSGENSIGVPVSCLVRIVDEKGVRVPAGHTGELQVYGAGIFSGYYRNAEASGKALDKGWFCTRDLAFQQPDGSVVLKERTSDIIKLPSGERLSLAAIEESLDGIDGIADYALCPRTHEERESVALFVVPRAGTGEQDLTASIIRKITAEVGAIAVPVFIDMVDRIPRGNHNKVLRQRLLDRIT